MKNWIKWILFNMENLNSEEEKTCENCKKYINGTTEEWCAKHCYRYPGLKMDYYEKGK